MTVTLALVKPRMVAALILAHGIFTLPRLHISGIFLGLWIYVDVLLWYNKQGKGCVRDTHSRLESTMTETGKFWEWMNKCPSKYKYLKDEYGYKLIEFDIAEGEEDETLWQE